MFLSTKSCFSGLRPMALSNLSIVPGSRVGFRTGVGFAVAASAVHGCGQGEVIERDGDGYRHMIIEMSKIKWREMKVQIKRIWDETCDQLPFVAFSLSTVHWTLDSEPEPRARPPSVISPTNLALSFVLSYQPSLPRSRLGWGRPYGILLVQSLSEDLKESVMS